ncbi:hypothetical protein DOY81_004210 [Sarcophaga bullata]|nr:hypothetical protein DOY81_004210 [Sarcophaga bullata]
MSSATPEITEKQKQILATFRSNLQDVLNETHDDYFLMRWLRARKWDPEQAEKMLRASLKTRAMWNVESLEKWDAPKALKEYLPYGMVGFDNEGSPIIVCPFYTLDMYGMLHCVTRFDFQRYVVMLLERFMNAGYEQSKIHGNKARQLVVFFDVADFNLKQYAWRPATELVISMIKNYEQNYPEILKMCYIVNAPKLFSIGFNFIKKFLDEYTMSKINIYSSNSDKWKDALFSHVDRDVFPKCFGGNYVEDGDEKCSKSIIWGGKIPKELYVEQKDDSDSSKNFIETVVNKGHKLKLEFDVGEKKPGEENQILSWEFRTIDYDIKFGIYSVDKITGEKQSEVRLGTVSSNEMDEIDTVVFDNSHSYLRNKKLRYWVSLISENDDISELPSQQGQSEEVVAASN